MIILGLRWFLPDEIWKGKPDRRSIWRRRRVPYVRWRVERLDRDEVGRRDPDLFPDELSSSNGWRWPKNGRQDL